MKNRTIDDLPSELLHLMLIKGCEEPPGSGGAPCPRTPKELARHARLVSRKWNALIDIPTSSWSFWVSRIFLKAQDPEERNSFSVPFAQSIAIFHRHLAISQGCDLEITFVLPTTSAWVRPAESFPHTSSIFLRLLLHALDRIIPYQAQVAVLRVRGNQPHIYYHVLDIIATRWMVAPRLSMVSFEQSPFLEEMPKTVSDLIDLPDLPGRHSILQTNTPIPMPVALTHLGSLDMLVIPTCSWLDGELELPTRLRYLKIVFGDGDTIPILYEYLTDPKRHALRRHLCSIEVEVCDAEKSIHPAEAEKTERWTPHTQLKLPSLTSITLNGVVGGHLAILLRWSVFPSLEIASLSPAAGPFLGSQMEKGSPSRVEGFEGTNTRPLRPLDYFQAPRCRNLKMLLPSSQHSIESFSLFTACPVERLDVSLKDWIDGSQQSNEIENLLVRELPKFSLRCLELSITSYRRAKSIIKCLDGRTIETLTVNLRIDIDAAQAAQTTLHLHERVTMPCLKKVVWIGREDHFSHFISHLNAACLKYLGLDLNSAASDQALQDFAAWDRERTFNDLEITPLLAVRSINLQLTTSQLSQYWKLLPNVEEMHVHIDGPGQSTSSASDLTESVKVFTGDLTRNGTKSGTLFPHLRLLKVSFDWRKYVLPSQSLDSDIELSEDEIRSAISQMLGERQRLKALPLVLSGPVRFFYEHPDIPGFRGVWIDFEACAGATEVIHGVSTVLGQYP
jgi:hypothetical protein